VHAYDFDKLGRQTQDRVTALGADIDAAVRRIDRTYEVRGLLEKATSYDKTAGDCPDFAESAQSACGGSPSPRRFWSHIDNATVGSGSVVNEVQRAYNTFGQLTAEYREHSPWKKTPVPFSGPFWGLVLWLIVSIEAGHPL
jgi:hypothetical protein